MYLAHRCYIRSCVFYIPNCYVTVGIFDIFCVAPGPVSNVIAYNEFVTSSTLPVSWMEVNLTNSNFSHYTVFYLPVRGPYSPIMASNRRKRQSAQAGELTMNFTGTNGILTDLYGAVTYRIQVAVVATLNEQEVIGDRSAATEIITVEGGEQIYNCTYLLVMSNMSL